MTLIVGLEHDGKVVVGADSFVGNGNHCYRVGEPKVFRNGPLLIGYCGSMRFGALMRHKLTVPRRNKDQSNSEYMATSVADRIRKVVADNGYQRKKDEREHGGFALIGYKGRLYRLQEQYDLTPVGDGWIAQGAGEDIAIGVLAATEGMDGPDRVEHVLSLVARFSPWVAEPFVVETA